MSVNFSDFCKEENVKQTNQEEKLKESYDELKNMDYDQLTERLYNEVKAQKDNGSFDYEELKSNVEKLKPLISKGTYENMLNMLEKIK